MIFKAETGSRWSGTSTPDSDQDLIEVEVEGPHQMILDGAFDTIHDKRGNVDTTNYSLAKFCKLLKRGSPTLTQVLWHDHPIYKDPTWDVLVEQRDALVSQKTLKKLYKMGVSSASKWSTDRNVKSAAVAYQRFIECSMLVSSGGFSYPLNADIADEIIAIKERVLRDKEIDQLILQAEMNAFRLTISNILKPDIDTGSIDAACVEVYSKIWGMS